MIVLFQSFGVCPELTEYTIQFLLYYATFAHSAKF